MTRPRGQSRCPGKHVWSCRWACIITVALLLTLASLPAPAAPRPSAAAQAATPATLATPLARPAPDAELEAAWYRFACHLNPANPGCTTVSVAVKCAADAAYPGCGADDDGDSCTDIAEVRAGFDPFNAADCIGSAGGKPAVNCLFLFGGLRCEGGHDAASASGACATASERRPNADDPHACRGVYVAEGDACEKSPRDPSCDGFVPAEGR